MPETVPELLRAAAATYEQRNKLYGDNYKEFGGIMVAMFPDGLPVIKTFEQHNRFALFVMCLMKLTRYAQAIKRGEAHQDSAHDLVVYAAMLEELGQ
jgi:hypothetical protein